MMNEKQTNDKTARKMLKSKRFVAAGIIVLCVIIVFVLALLGGGKNTVSGKGPQIPTVKINTPYIDLLIPMEVAEYITNDESTYGDVYTHAFYMNYGGNELPLWRVDFGDPYAGDWVGILQTEQGDIPIVMTGFAISDEELEALGEEGARLYGECMQGYIVMVEGIMSDPRFTAERPLEIGEDTGMELAYWKVTLPDKMKVQENSESSNYTATFSGEVAGEMVLLYRITIGDTQTGSFLGYFKVDGVKKAVSVESFDLVERDSWNEDNYAAAYRMMDTINDVIDTIMQSKNFSTEAE